MKSVLDRLALILPDISRWLEARSMLLSGRCEVLGLEEGASELRFVVRELIEEAARRNPNGGIVMAAPEDACHVLGTLPGGPPRE